MSSNLLQCASSAFIKYANHYAVGAFFLGTTVLIAGRMIEKKFYDENSTTTKNKILHIFLRVLALSIIANAAVSSVGIVGKGVIVGLQFGVIGALGGGILGTLIAAVNAYNIFDQMRNKEA